MSSGRIRFEQIDGLMTDTQSLANKGDGLYYDEVNEEFVPGVPPSKPLYGQHYQYKTKNVDASTSSVIYEDYLTMDTPVLPAGKYMLEAQYIWRTAGSNTFMSSALSIDGASNETHVDSSSKNNVIQRAVTTGFFEVEFPTAMAHTFIIQYKSEGAPGTVYLYSASIKIIRVE